MSGFRAMKVLVTVLVVPAVLVGCGDDTGAGEAAAPAASATGTPATSVTPAAGESEPDKGGVGLCGLFTRDEISERLGLPVGDGETNGPQDTQCQWRVDSPDGGMVAIQQAPADYWEEQSGSPSYRKLPGVGTKAYTAEGLIGGWAAYALDDKHFTNVRMRNGKASREAVAALIKEVLARG